MQFFHRFTTQILIGDHLAGIDALRRQRAGSADRAKINRVIPANRFADLRLNAHSEGETIIPFTIQNPRLWNGREDPFMYRAEISLWENDKLLPTAGGTV